MTGPGSAWQRYRVLRGPFEGCVAELVDFGADDSLVVVEVTLAGRTSRVELAREDLADQPDL